MKNFDNYFKNFIKLAILLLFSITFLRSLLTSFTHDEAYTYLHYVTTSFKEILSYSHATANNHMLNSILTKVCYHLIGQSELALRLPNTLALLVFLVLFFKWIFSITSNKSLILSAFVLMFLNNQLIEFFSLSRGYGLSFLFAFLALKTLIETISSSTKDAYKMFLWLILMVLSNFSTLIIFVAITGVFFINNAILNKNSWQKNLKIGIISTSILVLIIALPLFRLIKQNQFYFGGTTGFYTDTFHTIYQGYLSGVSLPEFVPIMIFGIIITTGVSTIFLFNKNPKSIYKSKSFIAFQVLVFTVSTNLILHYVIGSKFLIHRTALLYYGLIMMFVITYLIEISEIKPFSKWANISLILMSILLTFHFIKTYDFWKFRDWKYDSNTKEVAFGLNQFGKTSQSKLEIGTFFIFEPSFNYYIKSRNLEWLKPVTRDPLQENSSFYYLLESDTSNFVFQEMDLLLTYKNAQSNLYINPAFKNDQSQINTSSIKLQTPSWDF